MVHMTSTETFTPAPGYTMDHYAMTNRFLARRYFNNRDAKGRFVKRLHKDEVRFTTGLFFTDADDVSHAHANCGSAKGEFVTEANPSGWLCSTCVHVPTPTAALADAAEFVSKTGHKECECCGTVKKVTAFPTVLLPGVARRRGATCRACEAGRRASGPFAPEC